MGNRRTETAGRNGQSDKAPDVPRLFIGELAKRAGVTADTVRYYEHLGLMPRAERTRSGYRIYEPTYVNHLRFIQKAQKLGFTLEETKRVLDLRGTGQLPCDEVIQLAERRLQKTEAQLATLSALRDVLRKYVRYWKKHADKSSCAAAEVCNLIEEIELDGP